MLQRIVLMDTSIASENGGDKIIMDYCQKNMFDSVHNTYFCHVPTHDYMSRGSYDKIDSSSLCVVCGTNLLSSNMNKYNQWKIDFRDVKHIRNKVILLGVGWWQYQDCPNLYTRKLLKTILMTTGLHSVRDRYTEKMLKSIGIYNVIYTGCPTMWGLTTDVLKSIPQKKARDVVFTLTNYSKDIKADKIMYNLLKQNYEHIAVWMQAFEDYEYLCELGIEEDVEIINPSLNSYEYYLQTHECDYVGTRLHAGIKALNYGKRTIIISVDNRATEISKDTNLCVVKREKIEEVLDAVINEDYVADIKMPWDNIIIWKENIQKQLENVVE